MNRYRARFIVADVKTLYEIKEEMLDYGIDESRYSTDPFTLIFDYISSSWKIENLKKYGDRVLGCFGDDVNYDQAQEYIDGIVWNVCDYSMNGDDVTAFAISEAKEYRTKEIMEYMWNKREREMKERRTESDIAQAHLIK